MIQKLRRKLVLIVMAVVALMLLAIFFSLLITARKNNERMSIGVLRQALRPGDLPLDAQLPPIRPPGESPGPQMRLPVLVVSVGPDGAVTTVINQLHFIGEEEIAPIAALASAPAEAMGVLPGYALRYLREEGENGVKIALIDISAEQELLRTQVVNSLLVGGLALVAFFVLSLFLARWAVRPVEAAWQQQRQFIADASHELKTPLTVILSNADMLRAEIQGDKNARRTEHIHAEAVRMRQLVEDMLTLARSDSGEKAQSRGRVDFSYLVTNALLTYEPIFYDEGKSLSSHVEDGIFANGDPLRLQQVAHILLDNARKYSAPGGAARVRLSRAEHRRLLLEVASEGEPIPREDLARIFLRFYRRDASRSGHGSFGLGLSIAQSIVGEHGGAIWAESDGRAANRFYVSLPLA